MANVLNILDKDTGKYVSIPALKGDSAYEVAVQNGYKGTEEEWLASLKGEGADVDLSTYATIDYVDNALEDLSIDIDNVNLEGYATESWTKEYLSENMDALSNGYYEPTGLKGEDITADVIAINGGLPALPTFNGGTQYIVSGGLTSMWVNPIKDADVLYINDYHTYDANQIFRMSDTFDGMASDYYIYGAYNKDLLTKEDMLKYHKADINKWINGRSDGYFGSNTVLGRYIEYCGWSFYGSKTYDGTDATVNNKWTSIHYNTGTVSKDVQDRLDEIFGGSSDHTTSDGSPGIGTRKYPCVVINLEPYTTYTINYTGETGEEDEHNYMKGLHYCLTSGTDGGGCYNESIYHERHLLGTYTSTFTTGGDHLKLILFVGRIKNTSAPGGNLTSDSSSYIDIDIVNYNINNLSLVQGNRTYEYYIDMIQDIDFNISVIAMSLADESKYVTYDITIPYIMKPNQYIRFNTEQEIFTVSRSLVKAIGMRIDEIEDNIMNYKVGVAGVVGKWIDSKDIYRTVIKVTLPETGGSSDGVYTASLTLQDTVDSIVDLKTTLLQKNKGGYTGRYYFGDNTYSSSGNIAYLTISSVSTYLPTTSNPTQFYSTLTIKHGSMYKGNEIAIILEYTKYEMQEDGTII